MSKRNVGVLRKGRRQKFILVLCLLIVVSALYSPAAGAIKDIDITLAVDTHLKRADGVASHLIDIRTDEGVVNLTGSVDNLLAKERAADVAATIKGVRAVVNRIEVRPVPRTDMQLRSDIELALLEDPATDMFDIGVSVSEGTAFLTGRVDSWQERELCLQVVKGVRGIRELEHRIQVDSKSNRRDTEIRAEVEQRLKWDAWVQDALMEVVVMEGRVVLRGTVGSAYEKKRAFRDAWVAGVKAADDDGLVVDYTRQDEMRRPRQHPLISDTDLAAAVEHAFYYDPRVAAFKLSVFADQGVVTLTGEVDNLKARQVAEQDARNTVGVWHVKNHVKVRPTIGPATNAMPDVDAELARLVRIALLRDPYVHQHEISVRVSNRLASLRGKVDSEFEKSLAQDIASRVRGIVAVQNDISVKEEWNAKEDWVLKRDIENEIWWDPFLSSDDVVVSVNEGVVTLIGLVDTLKDRRAMTAQGYEGGAREVRNLLKVRNGPSYLRP